MADFRNSKIELNRLKELGLNVWVFIYWDKNNKKQQQPFPLIEYQGYSSALEKAKILFSWSKYEGVYKVDAGDEETRNANEDKVSHVYFSVFSKKLQKAVNIQLYNLKGEVDIQGDLLGGGDLQIIQQKREYK